MVLDLPIVEDEVDEVGRDYLCRSPNRAKRMECVQLAAAVDCGRTFEWALTRRKRQQAARTPYASRGSVTDRNNRALFIEACQPFPSFARVIIGPSLRNFFRNSCGLA